jgi:hypothetical protein
VEPATTEIEVQAGDVAGPGTAADACTSLKEYDGEATRRQSTSGTDAGGSRAYDGDVDV